MPDGPQEKPAPANACDATGGTELVTPAERRNIEIFRETHPYYAPNKKALYTMAFANGWGVQQDLKRATAFACHADTVSAGVLRRQIRALREMAAGKESSAFRYCSYADDPKTIGICGLYAEERRQKQEAMAQQSIARRAGFSAKQLDALDHLQHRARMFFRQQASKEYNRDGRDYAIRLTGRIRALDVTFNRNVRDFIVGTYPDATATGVDADTRLQATLKSLAEQTHATFPESRTLRKFHDIQFFWQEYRDAWLALLKARQPGADPAPFRAQLTLAREKQIRELYVPEENAP